MPHALVQHMRCMDDPAASLSSTSASRQRYFATPLTTLMDRCSAVCCTKSQGQGRTKHHCFCSQVGRYVDCSCDWADKEPGSPQICAQLHFSWVAVHTMHMWACCAGGGAGPVAAQPPAHSASLVGGGRKWPQSAVSALGRVLAGGGLPCAAACDSSATVTSMLSSCPRTRESPGCCEVDLRLFITAGTMHLT